MSAHPKPQEQHFLNTHGWSYEQPLAQDGSSRSYARVSKGDQSAILMINEGNTPGHHVEDFVSISGWLNSIGLNAPEIYEADGPYFLIEDFGDQTFKKAIEGGANANELYALADEVLTTLSVKECPLTLPDYYQSKVHEKRRWIIDYYLPTVIDVDDIEGVAQEYLNVWEEIERQLPECSQGFLHIDYHAENLMWMPDREGLARVGILDFQGGMIGPKPYDLANLLEDMRFDVPADIRDNILTKYDEEFRAWYRILATQFHCRLVGQIIWWEKEQGKPQYKQYLPRLKNYIHEALKDPLLRPLKNYFTDIELDF
ncbi:MAG: phosphotransferase [Pseudomonadota bacterium]